MRSKCIQTLGLAVLTAVCGWSQVPNPSITNISPTLLPAGSQTQNITINGVGFNACTRPRFDGVDQPVFSLVGTTQMTVQITSARMTAPTSISVSVFRYDVVPGSAVCGTTSGLAS